MVAAATGAQVRVIPLAADQQSLDLSNLNMLLDGAAVLALTQYSNVLGVQPPLKTLCAAAKKAGVAVVIDGTQAAVHGPIDLNALAALGVDFWACTGHKIYGPTGIGVLWGRPELLAAMPPYQGGGDMIETVRLPMGTTFAAPPARFEAGTPAIAEAIGLGAACTWLAAQGWAAVQAHENAMAKALTELLHRMPFIEPYSPPNSLVQAFNLRGAHPADVATLLDQHGIAVRSGHHCAMPLMADLGLTHGCVRASIGIYTTLPDIEQLGVGLHKAYKLLK
jgi:cysteine desulfurase/selenocysteine lyase